MSCLHQEIRNQPEVLSRLMELERQNILCVARELRARDIRYIVIAARGSSDNAARYAKYLFAILNGISVALSTPSVYTRYKSPPRVSGSLVVGISQSGESPDILSVVDGARAQGVPTLAITNVPNSPLAKLAEFVIQCRAGDERSIAATKTYTAQLTALALLASALSGNKARLAEIQELPSLVAKVLGLEEQIATAAAEYRSMHACVVVGRGYNYATAYEIALKLKELACVIAEPYSPADLLHGPIALVADGFPAVVVAPRGHVYDDMVALASELVRRGARLITISDGREIRDMAHTALMLAGGVPEWLSPITAVIPGQLFSLYLTLAKGFNPEHPRGLRKVTKTL